MRGPLVLIALVAGLAVAQPAAAASGWCGPGAESTDRLPDLVGGPQIHVVYAIPSDGADRFATVAQQIVLDLDAVDQWWRGQDPTRTLRFDLHAFAGCADGLGQLDLSFVRLPHDVAYFRDLAPRWSRLTGDLAATPLSDRRKKYLVFYDGPTAPGYCGQSSTSPAGATYSVIYVDSGWCGTPGEGLDGLVASTIAHELSHAMGILPSPGPPHACPGDTGHVCDSPTDLMWPYAVSTLRQSVLDVNHDDYYRHGGPWFDLAASAWLRHVGPQQPLAIRVQGTGAVTSETAGVDCSSSCTSTWDADAQVSLAPTFAPGTRLVRWEGDCHGALTCDLTLDRARSVVAVFGPDRVTASIAIAGAGTVSLPAEPLTCRATCRRTVTADTTLVLVARPARGWRFAGWSGACRGRATTCVASGDASFSVRAAFSRVRATA